jgi:Zn-dependent metalloprotease
MFLSGILIILSKTNKQKAIYMNSQPNPLIPLPCHATSPSCQGENEQGNLTVCTYNHQFRNIYDSDFESYLIVNGNCSGECQQALNNTQIVAEFVQNNVGLPLKNSLNYTSRINVNCDCNDEQVLAFWSPDGDAYFGKIDGQDSASYANSLTVVAHEFGHMLNYQIINLNYQYESGALDESYADIFAILVANREQTNDCNREENWNWKIGEEAETSIGTFRNLQNPPLYDQPEHWDNWVNTKRDHGGVHDNSGIHNRAAYELLISKDHNGNYLFDIASAANLFYGALLQLLVFKSRGYFSEPTFLDSRKAMNSQAKKQFEDDPDPEKMERVKDAIKRAFDSVGVFEEPQPPSDREHTLTNL